jgi:hypothetical protein
MHGLDQCTQWLYGCLETLLSPVEWLFGQLLGGGVHVVKFCVSLKEACEFVKIYKN